MTRRACILLSASVPSSKSHYALRDDERTRLDEAVMGIARATFSSRMRLVFGGHPAISPLVATIAGEYASPPDEPVYEISNDGNNLLGGALAGIYQSRVFEGMVPDETLLLFRLGFARIRWIDAVGGERFDPKLAEPASLQCPQSLALLRETMIRESQSDALVCAGGMGGIEEEISLFRRLCGSGRIYLLAMTGGATRKVAEARKEVARIMDVEVLRRLRESDHERGIMVRDRDKLGDEIRPAVLYPIVMQAIVREVLEGIDIARRNGDDA